MQKRFLIGCVLMGSACASPRKPGDLTSPTAIVTLNPIIIDGETGTPVSATTTATPEMVTITADGYLERRTRHRTNPTLSLWPLRYGATEEYVQQLVYNEYVPQQHLTRITTGVVMVVAGDGFSGNTPALSLLDSQTTALTALTRGKIQYALGMPIDGAVTVTIVVDPTDTYILQGYGGVTYNTFSGNVITASHIVVADATNAGVVRHELGHTLGLGHSPRSGDQMYYTLAGSHPEFSLAEQLQVTMMLQRIPGTTYPDDDTTIAGVLSQTPRTIAIACPRH